MDEVPLFEITLFRTDGREWDGWLCLPGSGLRRPFHSLPELLRLVDEMVPGDAEEAPRWRSQ